MHVEVAHDEQMTRRYNQVLQITAYVINELFECVTVGFGGRRSVDGDKTYYRSCIHETLQTLEGAKLLGIPRGHSDGVLIHGGHASTSAFPRSVNGFVSWRLKLGKNDIITIIPLEPSFGYHTNVHRVIHSEITDDGGFVADRTWIDKTQVQITISQTFFFTGFWEIS